MEDRYNVECCDFIHAHEGIVEQVRLTLPGEDTLYDLTELFRIFGDSTRIRILYVLFEAEVCVCDLAQALGVSRQTIISLEKGKYNPSLALALLCALLLPVCDLASPQIPMP